MTQGFRTYSGCTLTPCRRNMKRPHRLVPTFGLHDGQGRKIRGWPLLFSLDTTLAVQTRPAPRKDCTVLPEAIYAGLYFPHFGHFLTETVPNLAVIQKTAHAKPDCPIVMHLAPNLTHADVPAPEVAGFVAWFLDRLELDWGRFVFVDTPIAVDTLHVSPSPFRRKFRYSDAGISALERVFSGPCDGREDVYVSRRKWPNARVVNEPEIEQFFAARGYTIVHPQEMSLADQLALFRSAHRLAGPQGTALHWSLFSASVTQVMSLGFRSPLQKGICLGRGQTYIEIKGKRPKSEGLRVRSIDLAHIEAALG